MNKEKYNKSNILFENNPNNLWSKRNIIKNNQVQIIGNIEALKFINYINICLYYKNQMIPFSIDFEDYVFIKNYIWSVKFRKGNYYAITSKNKEKILLHRLILEKYGINISGKLIDHINSNTQDNRKNNLRTCNYSENNRHRKKVFKYNTTSIYKGVILEKQTGKWIAKITYNNLPIYLGYYDSEKLAAQAYNNAAKEYFGEFAYLNQI